MPTTYNNQNLFQESVVFGNFINCDDIKTGGNQANAKFKRNVLVGGDLTLGLESSTTTNGVTSYTDTSGSILVRLNGIVYSLTPQKLKYLSTISSDIQYQFQTIQDQIDDFDLTGNVIIGTTGSNILTINSKINAKNGIVYPTLVYTAYTNEYNRFFSNFVMFVYFPSQPTGTQLLPSIPLGTNSSTIRFYNNTPFTLTLTSQNSSLIYGLLGNELMFISLLPGYVYELTSIYGIGNYDNWIVTSAVNSQYQLVDIGTTQTIGGTKTFSTIPTYSGTALTNTLNDGTLATTKFVKDQGYLTSVTPTDLSNYVDKSTNQTISSLKTFATIPTYSGTALLTTLNDGTLSTTKFVKDQNYITTSSLNGNYAIGATANLLTINSQLLATNGFYTTTLVYNAYTAEYNRFFGNFVMFYNFGTAPTGSQFLPVILAGKSTTIKFYNNTPYTLQLSANTGSGIYGLIAPVGAQSVSLLSGYIYEFIIMYGASAYDNWFNSSINTQKKLVDEGTNSIIAGTKTFSVAPLYTGAYPADDNSTKLATTSWVKGVGFLTSASLTGLANLNSPIFTGTPTSVTPVFSDNSLKIATTQYVQNNLQAYLSYENYAIGGDITFTSGIYRYHIFKTSGTITFYKSNSSVNVFMIAGGGAGGRSHGGGGGAGEILEFSTNGITTGTLYTINVGGGGTIGGIVAGNSSFVGGTFNISVNGGGRGGGAINGAASNGGSGGGGSGFVTSSDGGQSTKNDAGFGTIGGNGNKSTSPGAGGGGGGGGSSVKGSDASLTLGGAGGAGTSSYFSNYRNAILIYMPSNWQDKTIAGVIASGGSGGSWGNAVVVGPAGGGGNGGTKNGGVTYPETPPTKGEDFTGSGGGGGGSDSQEGANGGSGLVVIKYIYNKYVTINDCITLIPPAHTTTIPSGNIFSKIDGTLVSSAININSGSSTTLGSITLSPGVYMIYANMRIKNYSTTLFTINLTSSISQINLNIESKCSLSIGNYPIVSNFGLQDLAINMNRYVDIIAPTTFYFVVYAINSNANIVFDYLNSTYFAVKLA